MVFHLFAPRPPKTLQSECRSRFSFPNLSWGPLQILTKTSGFSMFWLWDTLWELQVGPGPLLSRAWGPPRVLVNLPMPPDTTSGALLASSGAAGARLDDSSQPSRNHLFFTCLPPDPPKRYGVSAGRDLALLTSPGGPFKY